MADVTETDYTTDPPTITERSFTKKEKTQIEEDRKTFEKLEADRISSEQSFRQAKIDAIEHAKSLGFTDSMISVMYPSLD
jgi:hypothetical protein